MGAVLRLTRLVGALRVVHPVPSAIVAAVVASLAVVAGADIGRAIALGVAMLGFQVSIGAVNDVADADMDGLVKPAKPIPAGIVSARAALAIATLGAVVGLAISASTGLVVLVLGAAGLATGLVYDLLPRRWGLGWLCFVPAFPLLLAWTWVAAAGELPPAWPLLLGVAALAGPLVSLANGLVDLEADARTGRAGLAVRLGPRRGWWVLAALTATTYGLAWMSLLALAPWPPAPGPVLIALVGTAIALAGLAGSASREARRREAGWLLGAVGLGALGVAWVAAVGSAG
jgi:4-hydroxybenzoate polyprenyltransferase